MGQEPYSLCNFVAWLALHDRLAVKARSMKWGVVVDNDTCPFCGVDSETVHFFVLFYMC